MSQNEKCSNVRSTVKDGLRGFEPTLMPSGYPRIEVFKNTNLGPPMQKPITRQINQNFSHKIHIESYTF